MIGAELVTNAYRHAFPNMHGTITLSLIRSGTGGAILSIQNNGVGFVSTGMTTRRGIVLVRKLMEQMNGIVQVHSHDGTCWTLAFPVENNIPLLAA